MINNIKKILRLDTNIFKSALFQLTLTYLAIIMAVVSIFNIVIYNSLNIPEINDNKTINTYSHEIIEINSKKTRNQDIFKQTGWKKDINRWWDIFKIYCW